MRRITLLLLCVVVHAGDVEVAVGHFPAGVPLFQAAGDVAALGMSVSLKDGKRDGTPGREDIHDFTACGEGDACPHLNYGADVAFIAATNRFEFWIANGDLLGGMQLALEVEYQVQLTWNMDYGSHLPVNEEGRAVSCWNLQDLHVTNDFDNVSPDHFLLGGAAIPGSGLPAGPTEVCYSLQFVIPEGEAEAADGICALPYPYPPGVSWSMTDGCGPFPPDFCGFSWDDPEWVPACFDIVHFLNGDTDFSGIVNLSDVVRLLSYIFSSGPGPNPYESGDVNCDGIVNVTDAVYLLRYIFAGGPAPC